MGEKADRQSFAYDSYRQVDRSLREIPKDVPGLLVSLTVTERLCCNGVIYTHVYAKAKICFQKY